jgi:hypothetical protein
LTDTDLNLANGGSIRSGSTGPAHG